ncbi:LIPA [Cordylochernes scorpioides]|uniref:Lipase n=1 Tax=Cordylochernes scorpioides TaxID=51811 RepID=A0ABY6LG10_9ARAC|nr:LIPA [Cordylochernes scorpioides]
MLSKKIALFTATFNMLVYLGSATFCEPDCDRNTSQLAITKGYPAFEHEVVTQDGYILSMQNIPSTKPSEEGTTAKPILLMHGLFAAGHDYVINFSNQSLGFILADAGYDVWIGNVRGTTYSKKHKTLTPKDKEFWKFSFDEMALYDLPAMVDYVLSQTGQSDIFYIGHSQGSTMAFIMLSEIPAYNDKISLMVALGPVTNVTYATSPIVYTAHFQNTLLLFLTTFGQYEFLPNSPIIDTLSQFCPLPVTSLVCRNIYFLVNGINAEQFNDTRAPVYFNHDPAGTSAYNFYHWGQLIRYKRFQKLDWGRAGNLERYNQPTPPEYNVTKITTKVALFHSQNDVLADPKDVANLIPRIFNLVFNFKVEDRKWGHADFLFGMQANVKVYPQLLDLLEEHNT